MTPVAAKIASDPGFRDTTVTIAGAGEDARGFVVALPD
jgi:hypothetical protein